MDRSQEQRELDAIDWIFDWGSYWFELTPDGHPGTLSHERFERLKRLAGPEREQLERQLREQLSDDEVNGALARLDQVLEKVETGDIEVI